MVAIRTSATESKQDAVEHRARAAARQRRAEGGWRATQDGCNQPQRTPAEARRRQAQSASSSKAIARRKRLARHATRLRSAITAPSTSKPPSSIVPEQQRGNGEAKEADVSRKMVAVITNAPTSSSEATAGEGGWRVTQDGCGLPQRTREEQAAVKPRARAAAR